MKKEVKKKEDRILSIEEEHGRTKRENTMIVTGIDQLKNGRTIMTTTTKNKAKLTSLTGTREVLRIKKRNCPL